MNQREYSWETLEIDQLLNDIIKTFEENKYGLKMGSIINLNYKGENNIYDGQQRILTTILFLYAIGTLSPTKLQNKVNTLLTIDTDIDVLTSEQNQIKEKYKVVRIPKIFCINPYDMQCLVEILNNKYNPWAGYIGNIEEIESLDEHEEYMCKYCEIKISRKSDFIRHLIKQHADYLQPEKSTNLHNAFIDIYNNILLKKYDENSYIELFKFILYDIHVLYSDCNDPDYVSRIFDWENNRGKTVKTLDIIKNQILVKIPDDKKEEIYNRWEELKQTDNKIYNKSSFGQKIFDVGIQLYNDKITRKTIHVELFKPIIESKDTYKEVNKFFSIVVVLLEIMNNISNDKFGRLLNNTPRISICWETYMWLYLPIFYTIGSIDSPLIKLFAKFYFRNIQFKNRTFNNLCYSEEFIRISNEVLKNEKYEYYKEIEKCLKKNMDISISDENYLQRMKDMKFTLTNNATYLLMFIETCVTTNAHIVPLDEYTLEHIICKNDKENLSNKSLMDNIGNLTLLEGKNSENGHKGNCALGSKTYDKKKKSYSDSNCKITQEIPKNYTSFKEKSIIERNKNLIEMLNRLTNY
jgi:hypothetical protein